MKDLHCIMYPDKTVKFRYEFSPRFSIGDELTAIIFTAGATKPTSQGRFKIVGIDFDATSAVEPRFKLFYIGELLSTEPLTLTKDLAHKAVLLDHDVNHAHKEPLYLLMDVNQYYNFCGHGELSYKIDDRKWVNNDKFIRTKERLENENHTDMSKE